MHYSTGISLLLFCFSLFVPAQILGWYPRIKAESLLSEPYPRSTIGTNRSYILAPGETLHEIAWRGGLGFNQLTAANPGIDPWNPGDWQEILLPYQTILPSGARPGITINLAEFRLYLIWSDGGKRRVRVYPIGIGQQGWNSPVGKFEIKVKIREPSWTLPEDLRTASTGPYVVPPGPENPLGKYWLGLSVAGYGIHGTNRPFGVGRRVSHGCIRLYPDDIEDLNRLVGIGTPVQILYQPIKLDQQGDSLLIQVHPDYLGRIQEPLSEVMKMITRLGWYSPLDTDLLRQVLKEARGVPTILSQRN